MTAVVSVVGVALLAGLVLARKEPTHPILVAVSLVAVGLLAARAALVLRPAVVSPAVGGADDEDTDTGEWLWSADASGVLVSSNAEVALLLGYPVEDVLGRPLASIVEEADRGAMGLGVLLKDERSWSGVVIRFRHRDGSRRWLRTSGDAVLDSSDRVIGCRGRATDVTERVLRASAAVASRSRDQVKRVRIRAVLDDPTTNMHMVFQPIVGDGKVVGVEALARFRCAPVRPPDAWFAEAADIGLAIELELLAVRLAVAELPRLPPGYVAVNLSPATVMSEAFRELVEHGVFPPDRMVIELTEHAAIPHYDELQLVLVWLRQRGVRIAVDDAGSGHSSLKHILELRPDFIKLDRSMVTGIEDDPARQTLAAALCDVATMIGATAVAEGVERVGELHALRAAGIGHAQGYLFARPAEPPVLLNGDVGLSGLRSMVVDDDPVVRLLVSTTARRAGFEMIGQASDGKEGVELARLVRPDLIVLDLAMPVLRGEDALPALREDLPDAFIVILSATADPARARCLLASGADAFVAKDEVAHRLGEVFAIAMARRARVRT